MIQQNLCVFLLEENGEIIRITLYFDVGLIVAQNEFGRVIYRRTGLDSSHMNKVKKSIEKAIKFKRVAK